MRRFAARTRADGGFTLLELLAITVVIMILLSAAIATYVAATASANAAACKENRKVCESAAVIASATMGTDLDEIEDLRPFVKNFDTASSCPADGAPLLFSALTLDVTCPNHTD